MSRTHGLNPFKRNHRVSSGNQSEVSDLSIPTTPARSKSPGLHSALDRLRGKPVSTASQGSINSPTRPPNFVVAFVNTLNAARLSNLLTWFLFYDIVKLPESPSRWYKPIYSMEMRGWIALGEFLAKGTNYGLDLVVLDSICDRLGLEKQAVFECLTRLADPEKMAWTQLAATIHSAQREHKTEAETLKMVQLKLQTLRRLAVCLKPVSGTEIARWQPKIVERLNEFLNLIVEARLTALRTSAMEPFGMWDEKIWDLAFYYEAMQQERQVPLIRYGIYPDSLLEMSISSSSRNSFDFGPAADQSLADHESEFERSFTATSLKSEIRLLRKRIARLEEEKESLSTSNEALAKKLCNVVKPQPSAYTSPTKESAPLHNAPIPSTVQEIQSSPATYRSTDSSPATDYEDVFHHLDMGTVPNLTLGDPSNKTIRRRPVSTSHLARDVDFYGLPASRSDHRGSASDSTLVGPGLVRSVGVLDLTAASAATENPEQSNIVPSIDEANSREV